MSQHTLSVLVENKPGVLARIAGLFARDVRPAFEEDDL
jgi:acetolactate synthase-1/3 small subunit